METNDVIRGPHSVLDQTSKEGTDAKDQVDAKAKPQKLKGLGPWSFWLTEYKLRCPESGFQKAPRPHAFFHKSCYPCLFTCSPVLYPFLKIIQYA